jgi:DME family drug/metabolite transporter
VSDPENRSPLTGYLLILSAAVLWGTTGTAQTLAPAEATPPVLGLIRIILSGILLSLAALIRGEFSDRRFFLRPIFLFTGLCQAVFQLSYFSGIAYTGVAVGTMVAIGSCPIFAGLLGVIFDREKLTVPWITATVIAIAGLGLLTLGTRDSVQVDSRGIALALTAGFSYTLFTLLARRLIQARGSDGIMGISFLVGSIYLLPVLYFYPAKWIYGSPRGILVVLYVGFISAALAYILYGRGLKYVKVSTVGTLTLAEPLTAAMLGIFFVGEHLTALSGTGMAAIFISQAILVFQGRRKKTPCPPSSAANP